MLYAYDVQKNGKCFFRQFWRNVVLRLEVFYIHHMATPTDVRNVVNACTAPLLGISSFFPISQDFMNQVMI